MNFHFHISNITLVRSLVIPISSRVCPYVRMYVPLGVSQVRDFEEKAAANGGSRAESEAERSTDQAEVGVVMETKVDDARKAFFLAFPFPATFSPRI